MGTVVRVDQRGAYVDIGGKSTAFCPTAELALANIPKVGAGELRWARARPRSRQPARMHGHVAAPAAAVRCWRARGPSSRGPCHRHAAPAAARAAAAAAHACSCVPCTVPHTCVTLGSPHAPRLLPAAAAARHALDSRPLPAPLLLPVAAVPVGGGRAPEPRVHHRQGGAQRRPGAVAQAPGAGRGLAAPAAVHGGRRHGGGRGGGHQPR